jgi:predicted PurR-regulated permease PerM
MNVEDQQVQEVLEAVPAPEEVDPKQPPHVLLHPGGDPRNVGIIIIATIAILAILKWASAFFIPLMLGFVFYYALSPVVEAMASARIPRALGAAVLIIAILGGGAMAIWSLADDANELIRQLPTAAEKVRDVVIERSSRSNSPLEPVAKAAAELEKAAQATNPAAQAASAAAAASAASAATRSRAARPAAPAAPPAVQRVIVEKPGFDIREHLWSGTVGLVTFVGQLMLVTFLTYFLLLSGDTFRRKLVKIAGPGFTEKKMTVQALDEINAQIRRYLLVQLLASLAVGVLSGFAFAAIGLNHAAVWGVVAGVMNLVPYVGSILATVGPTLGAFMQAGDLELPMLVVGVSLVINVIEGYLLVPWATSKASRMNAVSVFIGVLFWGWLWGVWGLLLGIPIMMVIKAVCDRVDNLKPVGELLGT